MYLLNEHDYVYLIEIDYVLFVCSPNSVIFYSYEDSTITMDKLQILTYPILDSHALWTVSMLHLLWLGATVYWEISEDLWHFRCCYYLFDVTENKPPIEANGLRSDHRWVAIFGVCLLYMHKRRYRAIFFFVFKPNFELKSTRVVYDYIWWTA